MSNNLNQMPVLKFPTTTIMVDDSQALLDNFATYFSDKISVIAFSNPVKASLYLHKQKDLEKQISKLCFKRISGVELDVDDEAALVECNYLALTSLIYSAKRFATVAVALVDYAMPQLNGLEFCQKIKDVFMRKIMLTGKGDAKLAVKAFNQKIIDQFILKDAQEGIEKYVYESILKENDIYFKNLASLFPNNLKTFKNSAGRKAFLKILHKFVTQYKIVEWYQFDRSGSCLGLNAEGRAYWLVVRSEEELAKSEQLAIASNASRQVVSGLRNRTHFLFLFSDTEKRLPIKEWNKYIFPITGRIGTTKISYAVISDKFFSLKQKNIVSYNDYLRR